MNADQSATLAYALSLWADWLRNDFAEIRPLWYPARSMVLEVRQSVTESTDDDQSNDIERWRKTRQLIITRRASDCLKTSRKD